MYFLSEASKGHNFKYKNLNADLYTTWTRTKDKSRTLGEGISQCRGCEVTFQSREPAADSSALHKRAIEVDRYRFIADDKRSALPSESFPIVKSLERPLSLQ